MIDDVDEYRLQSHSLCSVDAELLEAVHTREGHVQLPMSEDVVLQDDAHEIQRLALRLKKTFCLFLFDLRTLLIVMQYASLRGS